MDLTFHMQLCFIGYHVGEHDMTQAVSRRVSDCVSPGKNIICFCPGFVVDKMTVGLFFPSTETMFCQ